MPIDKNHFYYLALAREKMGKWSKIVMSKSSPDGLDFIPTNEDITTALKGMNYFKYGVEPRVQELGMEYFINKADSLKLDIITCIKYHFGLKSSKAYSYCYELGFDLPVDYHHDFADRDKSAYIAEGGTHTNDCSVRAVARFLDIGYDEALKKLASVSNYNPAEKGTDSDILKRFCLKYGCCYLSDFALFNGKSFGNINSYELYAMVPLLKYERIAVGVYRHMFCINKGVIYDHKNCAHRKIDFIICRGDRERTFKKLFESNLETSPDIKTIAYERWTRSASWKRLAFDLRLDPEEIQFVTKTIEYKAELKDLMFKSLPKEAFIEWISEDKKIINKLSRRFTLEEDDVRNIIRIVQGRHRINDLHIPHV